MISQIFVVQKEGSRTFSLSLTLRSWIGWCKMQTYSDICSQKRSMRQHPAISTRCQYKRVVWQYEPLQQNVLMRLHMSDTSHSFTLVFSFVSHWSVMQSYKGKSWDYFQKPWWAKKLDKYQDQKYPIMLTQLLILFENVWKLGYFPSTSELMRGYTLHVCVTGVTLRLCIWFTCYCKLRFWFGYKRGKMKANSTKYECENGLSTRLRDCRAWKGQKFWRQSDQIWRVHLVLNSWVHR